MNKKIAWFLALLLIVCSLPLISSSTASAAQKKPKLNVKKLDMTLGNSFQLRIYNMKKKHKASYTSSNPSLVSVETISSNTKTAALKALGIGSSNITVTIQRQNQKALVLKCRVRVSPGAVSIKFIKRKVNIKTEQSFKADTIIKPSTSTEYPIFESSNPAVATVNPFGVITGVSPGTATITATLLSSNLSATCTVNVRPSYPEPKTTIQRRY